MKPKVIGRINLETGKWQKKTVHYYISWAKKHKAAIFCAAGFAYFVGHIIVAILKTM